MKLRLLPLLAIVCDPSNVTKALRTSSDVWFAPARYTLPND